MKNRAGYIKALMMAAGVSVYGLNGCSAAEEFRSVAGDSLKSGMTTIATGLIDGIFAVFEPDATSDTSN